MTRPDHLAYATARRTRLRALGLCLNGAKHGPATHGVLCAACRLAHSGVPRGLIKAVAETIVVDTSRRTH